MTSSTRTLTITGLAVLAIGVPVWLFVGSGILGGILVLFGVIVLAVAVFGHSQRANEPEARIRNEQADQQRLHDETAAGAENLEDRPPPTGG